MSFHPATLSETTCSVSCVYVFSEKNSIFTINKNFLVEVYIPLAVRKHFCNFFWLVVSKNAINIKHVLLIFQEDEQNFFSIYYAT